MKIKRNRLVFFILGAIGLILSSLWIIKQAAFNGTASICGLISIAMITMNSDFTHKEEDIYVLYEDDPFYYLSNNKVIACVGYFSEDNYTVQYIKGLDSEHISVKEQKKLEPRFINYLKAHLDGLVENN